MADTVRLSKPPLFSTVRSFSGVMAAESAVINTTNFPLTRAFEPYGAPKEIVVYWTAAGTVAPMDCIDVQPLYYDSVADTPGWIAGDLICGIRQNELARIPTRGCSLMLLRVDRVVCAAGTGLTLRAANSLSLH